jgi:hypothetical protein
MDSGSLSYEFLTVSESDYQTWLSS